MLKNNFKIALRYLKNHTQFTFISMAGLTMGFFCFSLLNAYVFKETSFDAKQEGVYRLLQKITEENGTVREIAAIPPKVGSGAINSFDEIDELTQIMYLGRTTFGNDPTNARHEDHAILDDNFLTVFDFDLLEGNKETFKNHPNGIVLTKSLKEQFFGQENALNKTLRVYQKDFKIVGVLQDFPENSHMENMIFITQQMAAEVFEWYDDFMATDWDENQLQTYFKLLPAADLTALGQKITTLAKNNNTENLAHSNVFTLQKVQDIHLHSKGVTREFNKNKGNILYVKLFFWIGLIILLVACFNYAGLLNIAFMDRAKEIGLRQVVGAGKFQLLRQFLTESLLLVSISMILAYTILWMAQPLVKSWFDTALNVFDIPAKGIVFTIISALVLSLLSVAYPFWLIVKPGLSSSLRQTISTDSSSKLPFRRVMLVFQFVMVIAFLTASFVFNRQMNFLENKELGFEMDGIATIDINSRILRNKHDAIKTEFLRIPEVKSVSVVSRVPGEWKSIAKVKAIQTGQSDTDAKDVLFIGADKDFLKTFEIKLLQGLNFSGIPADSTKVLVNHRAVENLGIENPIGEFIEVLDGDERIQVQISGVVEDFQMEDFRTNIKPLVIGNWNNPVQSIDYYAMKISTADWAKTLADLHKINDLFDPATPMEFNTLTDRFSRFFENDLLRFRLLNFFSAIVVFLACMGLFAMSSFVAKSRTKEIGIRKVLGSSVVQLASLLSKDFISLMSIGVLIASPIIWFLLDAWLSEFAFRIELKLWMVAVAALVCLGLTLITVSFQIIKAALTNPVESLRTE